MKTTNLTRIYRANDKSFLGVREDFDNGISLIYTEDKRYVFVKPFKEKGGGSFSEDEQKEISEYLRSKGFGRANYFKGEIVGAYLLCKFKDIDRTFDEISELVFNGNSIFWASVDFEEEDYHTTNDYEIVRDFCTYLYKNSENENIEYEDNKLDTVCMDMDSSIWNDFCKKYNYEEYISKCDCVNVNIWFEDNEEIKELHSLLECTASKNIHNVKFTLSKSVKEYINDGKDNESTIDEERV